MKFKLHVTRFTKETADYRNADTAVIQAALNTKPKEHCAGQPIYINQ